MVRFATPDIGDEEINEVVSTLKSGWLSTGPRVHAFEQAFAEYIGVPHAVALNSCTAALHLSLLATGVGPGDEVVTTPLTFCATANSIVHTGAVPCFADIDPVSWNLDPGAAAAAVFRSQSAAWAHVVVAAAYSGTKEPGTFRSITDQALRLTEEEADEHPQRSIITRALGPEPHVEVDTHTWPTRDGDRFLLCSDGLTTMIKEGHVADILKDAPSLEDAGARLIDAANDAGGRDNITVILFRLEDVGAGADDQATSVGDDALRTSDVQAAVEAEARRGGTTETAAPPNAATGTTRRGSGSDSRRRSSRRNSSSKACRPTPRPRPTRARARSTRSS